jgi:putative membrane protein
LGFLVAGAIPLLREGGPLSAGRTLLAVMAVVLALLVVVLARVRARQPLGSPPGIEVLVIGCATAGFAATTVVLLAMTW